MAFFKRLLHRFRSEQHKPTFSQCSVATFKRLKLEAREAILGFEFFGPIVLSKQRPHEGATPLSATRS
ncbi:hypothetical protein AYJ54_37880 [Bradyrhizobium centrolobii]|uniref:Uncharacterized protein n=1 Tax=Bradyrhizobium centrolobii TaxID=1505087 RepID=A0A176Z9X3_9BRAD|nr:hypothetical protein AYJ54_37880 [Bradyrhizobium centrolobii]